MTIKEILLRLWVRAVENGYLSGIGADREQGKALDDLVSLIQSGVEERIIGENEDERYGHEPIHPAVTLTNFSVCRNDLRHGQRKALHQWIKELRGNKP